MSADFSGDLEEVVRIVSAAGGELVGRTRLQKTAFLLELTGLETGFPFHYKHYGPYSEELAAAADIAPLILDFNETQRRSSWGGTYSVFTSSNPASEDLPPAYRSLVRLAKEANPIALELAATAAFLAADEKICDPWEETARRKPEKATAAMMERAKELYGELQKVDTPNPLPAI